MGHFAVVDRGDVPAADQELHNLRALPRQRRPARISGGILLQTADALPGKFKIDLKQRSFRRGFHCIAIFAEGNALVPLNERLLPYA